MRRIKICCINSIEEARLAINRGASALGLVSAMPSGPGVIDEMLIAEIICAVPPTVATFLLTSHQDADAILLDSGNQKLGVKELGGTGRTHDWTISRKIRAQCGRPLFLAGGLRPENVRDAMEQVQPFGVDICSGVRIEGRLDESMLRAFVAAAGNP